MTTEFFEAKVKLTKTDAAGVNKSVKEAYLVDAVSVTEAEARIIEEIAPMAIGEFEVCSVTKNRYAAVILTENVDADMFYCCKIAMITLDEKSGAEKRTNLRYLVQGTSIEDAIKAVKDYMVGSVSDYEFVSVTESAIIDVFAKKGDSND